MKTRRTKLGINIFKSLNLRPTHPCPHPTTTHHKMKKKTKELLSLIISNPQIWVYNQHSEITWMTK